MNRLETIALSDSGFAFDPMSGESFTLNETAIEVIRAMNKGKSEREIAEELHTIYEVETLDCFSDVLDFVKQLRILGLIEH